MKQASQISVITAAAALDLITEIVSQVSDQEFTDMLSGSVVTRPVLETMVASSLARQLSHQRAVVSPKG
jgi:hypothetical protein